MDSTDQMAEQLYQEGIRQATARKMQESVTSFRASLALQPDRPAVHFSLGCSLAKLKLWRDAIESFQRAVNLEPKDMSYRYGLGWALSRSGDVAAAIREFKVGLAIEPDNATLHHGLGHCLQTLHRYREALKHLGRAIELDQYKIDVWGKIGDCHAALGEHARALESFERALYLCPSQDWFLPGLIKALCATGDYGRAIKLATERLQWPGQECLRWRLLGDAFAGRARGIQEPVDYLHAIRAYDRALLFNERDIDSLYWIARAHEKLGNHKMAAYYWLRLLVLYPHPICYRALAWSQMRAGQRSQALGTLWCAVRHSIRRRRTADIPP